MTRTPWAVVSASFFLVVLSATSSNAKAPGSGIALTLSERIGGQSVAAIATDRAGNTWAAGGATFNPVAPTADALQPALRGYGDAFVVKLRADGSVAYATYLGGSGYDYATSVAVDSSGNVYVVGHTESIDFPVTAGAALRTPRGASDAFLTKLSADGRTILYSTYLGGADTDEATGVAADGAGRIHVIGTTSSANFPVTAGALRMSAAGVDAFYARFGTSGVLEYSTLLGGSSSDRASGIAVDSSGNAYVTGYTLSFDFTRQRALKSAFPATAGEQGFLAKFTSSGLDFSTYIGGSNSDEARAVAVSPTGVYVGGLACSGDFPGAPRPSAPANACAGAAFVTKLRVDGGAFLGTLLLDGSGYDDRTLALAVDGDDNVYAAGYTNSSDFPITSDAYQAAKSVAEDAFFAKLAMSDAAPFRAIYVSYLGGTQSDTGNGVSLDGAGGAWTAGWANSTNDFPSVHASENTGSGYVARFALTGAAAPASDDIVLYARDAAPIAGWRLAADSTAAAGVRLENPDAGVAKIGTASANPVSYFELTFDAPAGVPYHLWLRMKAQDDSWTNDSLFVQFSDGTDANGNPIWRIGSTAATVVSLEDCTGCGEHGWGWNDNGYGTPGTLVTFATSGRHTIRVQQREDGISVDQIVLSSRTYVNSAPGANRDDATILQIGTPPPPPPPPPNSNEIVLYGTDAAAIAGAWQRVADPTAAGSARLWLPDAGVAKLAAAAAAPSNYVDLTFAAQAGVSYHLWLRMKADADSWQNDSVFAQFSDSVDDAGSPAWRIGTAGATVVSLEDCSGCGEQAWGWNDNGYGAPGVLVRFAASGTHTLRLQQREDGISIDQIVLSAVKYAGQAPGAAKSDTTIVPK